MKINTFNAVAVATALALSAPQAMAESINLNKLLVDLVSSDSNKTQTTSVASTKQTAQPINSIQTLYSLAAWQEGKATDPDKILYVIIDPRCPYCSAAYKNLRPYVKQGMTVRWLSTQALGRSTEAAKLSAAVMRGGEDAHNVMSHSRRHLKNTSPVTKQEQDLMRENLNYLFESFKENPEVGSPGVPAAFYVDKNGNFTMLQGLSDETVVKNVVNNGDFL